MSSRLPFFHTPAMLVTDHTQLSTAVHSHLKLNRQTGNLPTPVDANLLRAKLSAYKHPEPLIKFLYNGFTRGFSTDCTQAPPAIISPNHKSVLQNSSAAYEKIAQELTAGRIQGPFNTPPYEQFISGPLGLVSKDNNKFRMIHDLSFPQQSSVNSGIPESAATVSYSDL